MCGDGESVPKVRIPAAMVRGVMTFSGPCLSANTPVSSRPMRDDAFAMATRLYALLCLSMCRSVA